MNMEDDDQSDISLSDVLDTDDGGAMVQIDDSGESNEEESEEHFENLVFNLKESELQELADDLIAKIEQDKEARSKRDELYEEGLRRTGLGDDAPGGAQFNGATRVVHPLLTEVCVDFSARAIKELFPPNGPVKTKLIGIPDEKQLEKATRKSQYMNWQCTEQMPEFRSELEQLLTQLPLGGVQYLKVMWNKREERPETVFVPVDDVYLPFSASNFYTAERKTHVQYVTDAMFRKSVKDGVYREPLEYEIMNDQPDFSKSSTANDNVEGREFTYDDDGLRTVYEVYTSCQLGKDEEPRPYIITIDKATESVLAVYRNWDPNDEYYKELIWLVEFPFVPWRGAYPIGITHMIGGIAGAATGALRALLDSAHLSNIPTLLKLKGGPSGQTLNPQPTEIIEIEGGLNVDDLRKMVMPIPFNGPNPTLLQLLGFLVEAGKGVVNTTFDQLRSNDPNQPVGTTLALIEQGMVVFSAIHARLHTAMKRFLSVLHRINASYLTSEHVIEQCGKDIVKPNDFFGPLDVVPISDPTIFSDTQRFAQIQAVMQRATMLPQLYNLRKVEEMFLQQLKIAGGDQLLADDIKPENMDPVQENVAASLGKAIMPMPKQDHMAHIQVHLAFLVSPVLGLYQETFMRCGKMLTEHVRVHTLMWYMQSMTEVGKAAGDDPMPALEQQQRQLEQMLAPIVQKIGELSAKYMQMNPPTPQDPMQAQMEIAKLQIQLEQIRIQDAQIKAQASQQEAQISMQLEQMRAQASGAEYQGKAQEAQIKMMENQVKAQEAQIKAAESVRRSNVETAQLDVDRQKLENDLRIATMDNETKLLINEQDNKTAIYLSEREIETGEKLALSNGEGINSNPSP